MGLYPTLIGDITLGTGINDIVVSGFGNTRTYPTTHATLIAHPSNTSVLYIRARSATTGMGFPLAAGGRMTLDNADLADYTASGLLNQRLAWAATR